MAKPLKKLFNSGVFIPLDSCIAQAGFAQVNNTMIKDAFQGLSQQDTCQEIQTELLAEKGGIGGVFDWGLLVDGIF